MVLQERSPDGERGWGEKAVEQDQLGGERHETRRAAVQRGPLERHGLMQAQRGEVDSTLAMDYFARGYDALRAAPQSASDTIDKLCTVLERADSPEAVLGAVLGLKGLSRDWNEQVGTRAVGLLVGTLEMGQEVATAAVETLGILCDASVPHCDAILAGRDTLPKLVALLEPSHFYLRFFTLQLLTQLLAVRPQPFQTQLLTAPGALPQLLITLDDQRELIRNEALLLVQALAHSNPDIQHLLAFEGVFDRLLAIIQAEGGIAVGGIIVHDCLDAIGALLRWNVSNQVRAARPVAPADPATELFSRNVVHPPPGAAPPVSVTKGTHTRVPLGLRLPVVVRAKGRQRVPRHLPRAHARRRRGHGTSREPKGHAAVRAVPLSGRARSGVERARRSQIPGTSSRPSRRLTFLVSQRAGRHPPPVAPQPSLL